MSKLFRNTFIYTIGNLLPKITGFILLPVYTYYMDPAEYGILSAMSVIMGVLSILLILSIPRSIPRLFFDYEDPYNNKVFFGTIYISVFIVASFQLSILFVFSEFVEKAYKNIPFYPYYKYALLSAFLSAFFQISIAYFRQKGEAVKFISYNFLDFFLITSCSLLSLILFKKGAESVLLGKLIGSSIVFIVTIYLATKIAVFKFDKKIFIEIMRFSLPLIPANIVAWTINMSDRIFVERYFDLALVGIYSLAYQIAQLTNLFGTSVKQAYDPWFFKQARDKSVSSKEKIKAGNNAIIIVISFIVFFISLMAIDGVQLFLDRRYHGAYIYIPIIALSVFLANISGLYNLAFYQEKKTKSLMYLIFIISIVNIGLNFLLIPRYNALGAAYATLLTFGIEFILKRIMANKFYKMELNWYPIIKYSIIMSVIVVYFDYFTPSIEVYYLIGIKILIFFLVAASFYFYNKKIIFSVFRLST